ncbi:nicotinate-nucleotide--dimethylbenzimidazole phosphoribosyltransferase [Tessaracoccus defluvii]|uniref:nicotinate-nucleotide--dimethylbenzimidazole phosphoribosyltransferase n=1 Tax=Tessaracoccus defluvii TaxID=1285901 RepID=UPI0021F6F302|nr:nicotinate-nucleotide--dimethylbenzimidazole phosphoribosyltransferase [Tessaracoccus defluvii]
MITPPDPHVLAAARAHVDSLAKPPGALGRLEDVAVWLAGCQGVAVPRVPARPRCIVLAGDHGVVADGVASFPSEITVAMILPILQGRAGVSTIAAASGTSVALYDISVAAPSPAPPRRSAATSWRWAARRSSPPTPSPRPNWTARSPRATPSRPTRRPRAPTC